MHIDKWTSPCVKWRQRVTQGGRHRHKARIRDFGHGGHKGKLESQKEDLWPHSLFQTFWWKLHDFSCKKILRLGSSVWRTNTEGPENKQKKKTPTFYSKYSKDWCWRGAWVYLRFCSSQIPLHKSLKTDFRVWFGPIWPEFWIRTLRNLRYETCCPPRQVRCICYPVTHKLLTTDHAGYRPKTIDSYAMYHCYCDTCTSRLFLPRASGQNAISSASSLAKSWRMKQFQALCLNEPTEFIASVMINSVWRQSNKF